MPHLLLWKHNEINKYCVCQCLRHPANTRGYSHFICGTTFINMKNHWFLIQGCFLCEIFYINTGKPKSCLPECRELVTCANCFPLKQRPQICVCLSQGPSPKFDLKRKQDKSALSVNCNRLRPNIALIYDQRSQYGMDCARPTCTRSSLWAQCLCFWKNRAAANAVLMLCSLQHCQHKSSWLRVLTPYFQPVLRKRDAASQKVVNLAFLDF